MSEIATKNTQLNTGRSIQQENRLDIRSRLRYLLILSNITAFILLFMFCTVAFAQKSNTGFYTSFVKTRNVPLPSNVAAIDNNNVKYLQYGNCDYNFGNRMEIKVYGMVSTNIDLSDDLTAQKYISMGIIFGNEQCPKAEDVSVSLVPGNPSTFSSADFKRFKWNNAYDMPNDYVWAGYLKSRPNELINYTNTLTAMKQTIAYDNQIAQQRIALQEQERQAEQKKHAAVSSRYNAFVKTNGVTRFVTVDELTANPFIYQNQIVAIIGEFEQMNTATQGHFSSNGKHFIVSKVPSGKFTRQHSVVMLAGRVVGKTEIKLPVLGPTLLPELSFVGCVFCNDGNCSEFRALR